MLDALRKYTINTGLIATIWTVFVLIATVIVPNLYVRVELVFYLPLSKVYANALLGSLNVRDSIRERSNVSAFTPQLNPSTIVFSSSANGQHTPAVSQQESKAVSIRVDLGSESSGSTNNGEA